MDGTATINLTPLYGSHSDEPLCSVLQIDDFRILLDCGWDERFDENNLQQLKQIIPDINAVLISHSKIHHLGALPYAVGKLGLSCPIYCTLPVKKMGELFMYDLYQAKAKFGFSIFNLDDVDAAFEKVIELKYSQDVVLNDKSGNIVVTPYAAGHSVGGTIWKITKETEEIVYAVDYNHRKERHLSGSVLITFRRPTVLITDAVNGLLTQDPMMKNREKDKEFCATIVNTIRGNGNVLIPCDTAGRVLELLLLIQLFWTSAKLGKFTYSLVFLSNVAFNTVDFARSQMEWMSEACQKAFNEDNSKNPFNLKDFQICHNMQQLREKKQPYVCLATSETLDSGFAQEVFMELAKDPKNLILFTNKSPSHTLASELMATPTPKQVSFKKQVNVILEGEELSAFLEAKELAEERLKEGGSDDEEDDVSESEDEDMDTAAGPWVKRMKLTPAFSMYPYVETKKSWDVYGEVVDVDEYKTEVTQDGKGKNGAMVDGDEEDEKEEEKPYKTITQDITIDVECAVKFMDYQGRSDAKSVRNIISHVQPRKLILLNGTQEAKDDLKDYCLENVTKEVLVPKNGQCVDITSETNIYRVNLKDTLTHLLNFVKVGDYEVAYTEGQIAIDYEQDSLPVLKPPAQGGRGHSAVFLGNLRFQDLKKVLDRHGIQSEFYEGVLVCENGLVNIRKVSETQISLQGSLSMEYYKIRSILYGLYEIL